MRIVSETTDLGGVHSVIARPDAPGPFPAVVAYPDIFQLTPPHLRIVSRLASYGFIVVAPELYGHFEPKGTVFDFDADRERALTASTKVVLADVDRDVRAVLDAVSARADVASIGVLGFCFGGHVALRAAFDGRVKAAACCYPTGVHDGKLGACDGAREKAGTIERVGEIKCELLLVWGRRDPHIPAAGRAAIHRALEAADVKFEARLYDAEHTFMRDVGARYDGEAADRAIGAIGDLFRRNL